MSKVKRNPPWVFDELVLAIDLMKSSPNPLALTKNSPKVLDLSNTLRQLRIFREIPNSVTFRNENGVSKKILNLYNLECPGQGLEHGGSLDKVVMELYKSNPRYYSKIAQAIEQSILALPPEAIFEDQELDFPAGRILFRWHRCYERNFEAAKHIQDIILTRGHVDCEACGVDYRAKYGRYV